MSEETKTRRSPQAIEAANLEESIKRNEETLKQRRADPATEENLAIIKRREQELAGQKERLKVLQGQTTKAGK